MKRLLLATALWGAAFAPLAVLPAQGQARSMGARVSAPSARIGMRSAPAARVGFSARPGPGVRQFGSQTRFVAGNRGVVFSNGNFRNGFGNNVHFGFRNRHHRFHNNGFCFDSFNCGFFNSGLVLPWYPFDYGFNDFGYNYAAQPEPQPVVVNNDEGSNRELAFEVERLTDEVESMREDTRRREQARNSPPERLSATPEAANTILVFRDGHQMTIQNYAVAGPTLWILNEHTAKKVAIADLDVPATQQANEKNGVAFRAPVVH